MKKQPFRILVVDDEEEVRAVYADVFREGGFEVDEARDGLEALEAVDREKPDLIFTGIMMPRMDGFTLVENLRKNVATMNIPVVFSSHLGRREDETRARELGAKDFVVKGTTGMREVVGRVKRILEMNEYFLDINPTSLDARLLARDLGIDESFMCGDGKRYALRLLTRNVDAKTFDAELVALP
jgi:DNA-binding response OmpR family regulator